MGKNEQITALFRGVLFHFAIISSETSIEMQRERTCLNAVWKMIYAD